MLRFFAARAGLGENNFTSHLLRRGGCNVSGHERGNDRRDKDEGGLGIRHHLCLSEDPLADQDPERLYGCGKSGSS